MMSTLPSIPERAPSYEYAHERVPQYAPPARSPAAPPTVVHGWSFHEITLQVASYAKTAESTPVLHPNSTLSGIVRWQSAKAENVKQIYITVSTVLSLFVMEPRCSKLAIDRGMLRERYYREWGCSSPSSPSRLLVGAHQRVPQ